MKKKSGFTLVELITVIFLLGIIGTIVGPRFFNVSSFSNKANADKVKFLLKIGQKMAIAQRRDVYVILTGNELGLCYTNSNPCPNNQKLLVNNKDFIVNLNGTPTILPNLKFNSLGNTGIGKITIQVGNKNIYIEEESGYIHE